MMFMSNSKLIMVKQLFMALLVIPFLFACNNNPAPKNPATGVLSTNQLNKEQLDFIAAFAQTQTSPVYMMSVFRNRYFKPTDQKESDKYFKKIKALKYTKELVINKALEIQIDPKHPVQNIHWVNEEDVQACNKQPGGTWPCMEKQYQTDCFFYLSVPLISQDGEYALVHINYMHKDTKKSYGGGRIFAKENNKWTEIALLTNWGNLSNE